jgi:DNA-binding helix-hairpin-helix protein with protein kinase domain
MLVSRWRSEPRPDVYLARGGTREPLRLGEFIGEGNSAEVFGMADAPWKELVVAKIYLPGKKPQYLQLIVEEARAREIGKLGGRGSDAAGGRYSPLATPKAFLFPSVSSSEPCGLLVTKVDPERFVSLDRFMQTSLKSDLVVTSFAAESLAEIVAWLHEKGYIVGDFSGTNVQVDKSGHVCLLDVDSFGIVGHGYVWASGDSSQHYIAPEMLTGETTQESDRFILTMLITQLLLAGASPFAGVEHGRRDSGLQDNINHGLSWLFSPEKFVLPSKLRGHPGLAALPESTQRLVRRGLGSPGQRPSAQEWVADLHSAGPALENCTCGAKRFRGAACQICKSGYAPPQNGQSLPKWGYAAEPAVVQAPAAIAPAAVRAPAPQVDHTAPMPTSSRQKWPRTILAVIVLLAIGIIIAGLVLFS